MTAFYAVAKGRVPGIYRTWEECEAQVKGFPNAKFKKFHTMVEAQDYIVNHGAEEVLRDKLRREAESKAKR